MGDDEGDDVMMVVVMMMMEMSVAVEAAKAKAKGKGKPFFGQCVAGPVRTFAHINFHGRRSIPGVLAVRGIGWPEARGLRYFQWFVGILVYFGIKDTTRTN